MLVPAILLALPVGALVLAARGILAARAARTAAARAAAPAIVAALAAALAYVLCFPLLLGRLASSTSGLAYLWLPLASMAFGLAVCPFAWAVALLAGAGTRRSGTVGIIPPAARHRTTAAVLVMTGALALAGAARFEQLYATARSAAASGDALRGVHASYARWRSLYGVYAALTLRQQNNHVLAYVAEHPRVPEDVWSALIRDPDASVRWRAWRNPAIGADVLLRLSASRDPATRAGLASNESTPTDVLRRLALDGDVDGSLYQNPSLPEDAAGPVLTRLYTSSVGTGSEYYRASYADNRKAPPELLEAMSHDTAAVVREHAAFNPRMPPDALVRLSEDRDPRVRRGVAGNPSTPREILRRLLDDSDESVRGMARGNHG